MLYRSSSAVILLLLASACSTTPGDAAYRSDHPTAAADLYRQGANQGDPNAALKLGLLISNSEVSASQYGSANSWFEKACSQQILAACHNAGVGYEYGKHGVSINYSNAEAFYLKAAENGYMQSQYNLGSLHANQNLHNDVQGLKWLLLAQATANKCPSTPLCQWVLDDPPGHISTLKKRMQPQEIERAQSLSSQWLRGRES